MKHRSNRISGTPLLTVAVPAYNVEQYISECLESLVDSFEGKLEVVVVDDGSSDNTATIAQRFADNCPHIRFISKENGGHGSTINTALRESRGRYFKVVDGDDMVDTESLGSLLNFLDNTDADIVLTDYIEYYMLTDTQRTIQNYRHLEVGIVYNLESTKSNDIFPQKGPLMATTTFKTDIYRHNPFFVDEHCFYVDMEYNFFIYERAVTTAYLPLALYKYRLEREGQSMLRSSLKKNYQDHERVCLRLASEMQVVLSKAPKKYDYLMRAIVAPLCLSHYQILTEFIKSAKLFRSFDNQLKRYPAVYRSPFISGKIIYIHRTTHGVLVASDILLRKLGGALKHREQK